MVRTNGSMSDTNARYARAILIVLNRKERNVFSQKNAYEMSDRILHVSRKVLIISIAFIAFLSSRPLRFILGQIHFVRSARIKQLILKF